MRGDAPTPDSMEQGVQLSGCGICAVLQPAAAAGTEPCCDGGARFVPAQMMSADLVRGRIAMQLTSYIEAADAAARRASIAAICHSIQIYGRPAREEIEARGHSLDAFRAVWESGA